MRELEKLEINGILGTEVIEPTRMELDSLVVIFLKKNRTFRVCLDHCKWKATEIQESYSIPFMDKCIDLLGDATPCLTLDANGIYWHVDIATTIEIKVPLHIIIGLLHSTCMPFVMKKVAGTVQ